MKKRWINSLLRPENGLYIALWMLLFASIPLSLYLRTHSAPYFLFRWGDVFFEWRRFVVYLVLFLVHNLLLAPLLVSWRRRTAYFVSLLVVATAFAAFNYSNKPQRHPRMHHPPMELQSRHRPLPPRSPSPPSPFFDQHDILAIAVLLLMFGANLGIKVYFRSHEDRKRLSELEKQNLEHQLEYLRYQINPHFFMNTLNNIHALVDIDPQKAKTSIVELSKMMRYVLYDGNKQSVALSQELDFIRHYVFLMQLRYTDHVRIELDLPQGLPERHIPPLILITFVENAFKHGISYQKESFVHVKVAIGKGELHFTCHNSKAENPNQEKGGVGLANVQGRLDLLYGRHYTLHIDETSETYTAILKIPLS